MFHVVIRGKRWKFLSRRLTKKYGECDYDERLISIRPGMDSASLAKTILHESLHAQFEFLSEEAVREAEGVLFEALDGAGAIKNDTRESYKRLRK